MNAAAWWNALTARDRAVDTGRARDAREQPRHDLIVLVIKPAPKPGRFLGYVGDELMVTSRQPFLDGARAT
jgi:hypothetical protein